MMKIPYFDQYNKKNYGFETTAPNGSFQTPYFGERFNVSLFDYRLECDVCIYVPDNLTLGSKMVVDIDYDIIDEGWMGNGWTDSLYIFLESKQTRNSSYYQMEYSTFERLVDSKKNAKKEFSVAEDSTEAG